MIEKFGILLGYGAGSDVYEYGENKVCKLYKKNSCGSIESEYRKTLDAYNNGLPVPKIYEIIEYEGRKGIIMDRVYGTSYMEILFKHIKECHKKGMSNSEIFDSPVNMKIIYNTAEILYKLHQKRCDLNETATNSLKTSCKNNRYLSPEEKEGINNLIDKLPGGDSVCHGDPNPGNIIKQDNQLFLIDWNCCVKGSPLYDLSEYIIMYRYCIYDLIANDVPEEITNFMNEYKDENVRVFMEHYVKLSNIDLSVINMWVLPKLVEKMGANNSVQKQEAILGDIKKRLSEIKN